MSDATQLRLIIAVAGVLLLLAMYWFGQPKRPKQGTRLRAREVDAVGAVPERAAPGERREPVLGDFDLEALEREAGAAEAAEPAIDPQLEMELSRLSEEVANQRAEPPRSTVGARGDTQPERIVNLYVVPGEGQTFAGSELVVAIEKLGLAYGDLGIFHRLVDGRGEPGPVFSLANSAKPGSFDLRRLSELRTPGVTLFMTLPGPLPALDAWDMMYPAAQRLAELLDGRVLDAERNAIGRQTIQHMRDELRAWDRRRERQVIKKTW